MRIIEGTPEECAAFLYKACQPPVAETSPENQPIPYSPHQRPSKEATAKLRAIFTDYVKAGMTSQTIQEDLVKSWDIRMSLKQIAGWLGQAKGSQGMAEKPKAASSTTGEAKISPDAQITPTPSLVASGELSKSQIDMIKKLYNKQHITPKGIAKELQIPLEKVEKVVGWA